MEESARVAVEDCMNVSADETVLVVTDEERREIGRALYDAAGRVGSETVYVEIAVDENHGAEPPAPVGSAMRSSDVVFAATTRSLTHTEARQEACGSGARVATLPGITREVMEGAMRADYGEVADNAADLLDELGGADEVRIETDAGTDLTLRIGARDWHPDDGICHEDGCVTNLPAGEVYVAPETGDGTLVIDGSLAGFGVLDEAVRVEFEDGRATSVSHDGLRERMDDVGDCGRNLAELGVGVNPTATLIGNVLQDEKVRGTVHVAVGDSSGFGGDVECDLHVDGVVTQPRLYADGERVELDG
ncbi:MAG: leucyl aminopeptidase (aminopeptidase T) [Methanobacteriota archaeon]|jgi:leucyl aminopeptidase (aminopeptidase T)|uniref:Aminopeptidase n=1 Tax=Halorutilus salinus TaxID=2487751 RepID=A0A9Q4GJU3_9EURY|nr:aminopeptidase [Halorutilus salinus]MCX2819561.1 aminopeptidase [Halorutilus salinus]